MRNCVALPALLCCMLSRAVVAPQEGGLRPVRLRCEYVTNPAAIDTAHPRFFWNLDSPRRAQYQSGYRILVASSPARLAAETGDVWDTGHVKSDATIQISYAGKPLESGKTYFWKVRVWDGAGLPGGWSEPAHFGTGLATGDWKAKWIVRLPEEVWRAHWQRWKEKQLRERFAHSQHDLWETHNFYTDPPIDPAPLLRKSFRIAKPVRTARLDVTGLGYYELRLNGKKVGDHVTDPGVTNYDKGILYATYDVTGQLKPGVNAMGMMLGRGWYSVFTRDVWRFDEAGWIGQPKLLLRLAVEFQDGTREIISSNETWKTADGPIIFDSHRNGEIYDARNEKPGWDTAAYDDSGWQNAIVAPAPRGELRPQMLPPVKVTRTVQPVSLTNPKPGEYIYDLGQNMAGWAQLRVKGPKGTRVTLTFSEHPNNDGTFSTHAGAGGYQQAIYILKGEGEEVYEPRFSYYGFRYVRVTGFPGAPTLDSLRGRHVHTALDPSGTFECSNPLVNRIHRNFIWTYLNAMQSFPQDCPHREKLGWAGDAHAAAESGIQSFDTPQLYAKYVQDFEDAQAADGTLPAIAPTYGWGAREAPTWTGAYVIIPWYAYQYYGDTRIFERHFESMKRWVDSIQKSHGNGRLHIVTGGPADWLPPYQDQPGTPEGIELLGTAYYLRSARIVAAAARLLGREEDARRYGQLADGIAKTFNEEYFDAEHDAYRTQISVGYRQTSNAEALSAGVVPEEHRAAVARNLANRVMLEHNGHLDTGVLGTKALMDVLPRFGFGEAAYAVVTQKTYPGWGWQIVAKDATTIWEWWDGAASQNHPMYGSVGAYFYKHLAGIRTDPEAVAYKRVIIEPQVVGDLVWVNGAIQTIRGKVASSWKRHGVTLTLDVEIPAGSTARIAVPKLGAESVRITEGSGMVYAAGKFVPGAEGVKSGKETETAVVFETGSGRYSFHMVPAAAPPPVRVAPTEAWYDLVPGGSTDARLRVENIGKTALTGARVEWSVPEQWLVMPGAEELGALEPGKSHELLVHITAPRDAKEWETFDLRPKLTAETGKRQMAVSASVTARVFPRFDASTPLRGRWFVEPGQPAFFEVRVKSRRPDRSVTVIANAELPAGWEGGGKEVKLAPGQAQLIGIRVLPAKDAALGSRFAIPILLRDRDGDMRLPPADVEVTRSTPGLNDAFADPALWRGSPGTSVSRPASGAAIRISGAGQPQGFLEREVSIDLEKYPYIVVDVPQVEGKWSLRVLDDTGIEHWVSGNPEARGRLRFNLRQISDWNLHRFRIRFYWEGEGTAIDVNWLRITDAEEGG